MMTPEKQRLTVMSDASFCPETRAAGWAGAIILADGTSLQASGPITGRCAHSNSAEAFALAAAFQWAIDGGHARAGAAVTLVTDSQHLQSRIKNVSRRRLAEIEKGKDPAVYSKQYSGSPVVLILALAMRHNLVIEIDRLPGHPPAEMRRASPELKMMGALDQQSRVRMRQEQERIRSASIAKKAPARNSRPLFRRPRREFSGRTGERP